MHDAATQSAEVIFFEKAWRNPSRLQVMLSLIQSQLSPLKQITDTLFSTYPYLFGSLYFYIRFLSFQSECGSQNRDFLISDIIKQPQESVRKWICFVRQSFQATGLTQIFREVVQPKPVKHMVIKQAADIGLTCQGLDDLLNQDTCGHPLVAELYTRYHKHRTAFLRHFLRTLPNTCYSGEILVACNIKAKWAQVFGIDDGKTKCRGVGTVVMAVDLEMGPFEKPSGKESKVLQEAQLKSQAEVFRSKEKQLENQVTTQIERNEITEKQASQILGKYRQGHAMVLILDLVLKTIELFEPNGNTPWDPLVFDALREYWKQDYPQYRWIAPAEYCPRRGIQSVSDRPMCAYFSLLWIYLRVHCPFVDRQTLSTSLLRGGKELIDHLISALQCL